MDMTGYKLGDTINTRNLIGDTLCELAANDERVWAVTSDCGANLGGFAKKFPARFVETGIAEQNAAGTAAGLALSGAVVHIMGMAPFVVMRALEQNRSAIAYQNLPVRVIGSVGGMTTGGGATHYALEDIALMRSIANMAVLSLSDPLFIPDILRMGMEHDGPFFLRITSGKSDPVIYEPGSVRFAFGKGIVAREGADFTIMAHGCMVQKALELSDKLRRERGMAIRVVDMCSVKPLDEELVVASAKETGGILVWEDHFVSGGLATAVSDALCDRGVLPEAFARVGVPMLYPGFGSPEELYRKFGMDSESVEQKLFEMLR